MDRACTAPRQDIKARPVPAAPEAARRRRREGRGAGTMRRSGLLNLVPRAQNRCVICAALVRAARPPRGMSWQGNRGKRAAGGHGMPLAWESVLAYQRGFQHERRSNSVRHRRLDHRAMAGRLFRGRPARGAAGRPRRRAGRARGQCLDPAGRRPALARQLDELARLLAAADGDLSRLPLYGVPYAVRTTSTSRAGRPPPPARVRLHARRGCRRGAAPAPPAPS